MYGFFRDLILVVFYPNFTVFIEEITVDGVAKTVSRILWIFGFELTINCEALMFTGKNKINSNH